MSENNSTPYRHGTVVKTLHNQKFPFVLLMSSGVKVAGKEGTRHNGLFLNSIDAPSEYCAKDVFSTEFGEVVNVLSVSDAVGLQVRSGYLRLPKVAPKTTAAE